MLSQKIINEIRAERQHSIDKHGKNSMEYLKGSDPAWLAILVEEIGETAKALTYDNKDNENLRDELIDVLAVASSWVEAMDRDKENN